MLRFIAVACVVVNVLADDYSNEYSSSKCGYGGCTYNLQRESPYKAYEGLVSIDDIAGSGVNTGVVGTRGLDTRVSGPRDVSAVAVAAGRLNRRFGLTQHIFLPQYHLHRYMPYIQYRKIPYNQYYFYAYPRFSDVISTATASHNAAAIGAVASGESIFNGLGEFDTAFNGFGLNRGFGFPTIADGPTVAAIATASGTGGFYRFSGSGARFARFGRFRLGRKRSVIRGRRLRKVCIQCLFPDIYAVYK